MYELVYLSSSSCTVHHDFESFGSRGIDNYSWDLNIPAK